MAEYIKRVFSVPVLLITLIATLAALKIIEMLFGPMVSYIVGAVLLLIVVLVSFFSGRNK